MNAESDFKHMLRGIQEADLPFDGDCRQAIGIDVPIAVINLPHRTDRWEAVSTRLAAVGLNKLIRVPAINGNRLSLDAIQPILGQPTALIEQSPDSHFTLTRPAIGCFLSHLSVWRWMVAKGLPKLLVFEDDAMPVPGFDQNRFRATVDAVPSKSGLLFMGRILMNGMAEEAEAADLARLYFYNGTFAYLITPAATEVLIPSLLPMNGHIDHEMSKVLVARRNDFSAHCAEPPLFEPDWSLRSDCYVPLDNASEADQALGALLGSSRELLLSEGRPLRAPYA